MRSEDNERVTTSVRNLYAAIDKFRGGSAFNWLVGMWNNFVRLRSVKSFVKTVRGHFTKNLPISSKPNILFATSTGRDALPVMVETVLSASCALKGSQVFFSYCVGSPICNLCNYKVLGSQGTNAILELDSKNPFCSTCRGCVPRHLDEADWMQRLEISGSISNKPVVEIIQSFEKNQVSDFEFDFDSIEREVEIPAFGIFQHAMASALKFFAIDRLDPRELAHVSIFKKYLRAAISYAESIKTAINTNDIDVVVVNHGIYCPQGVFVEMANYLRKRVVCWNLAYRRNSFIFAHGASYHYDMVDRSFDPDSIEWSDDKLTQTTEYLSQRRTGETDWLTFQGQVDADKQGEIARYLAFKNNYKRLVGVLTNVAWDAQVHFKDNVYARMSDWLNDMVKFARDNPEIGLVVRVHPAETSGLLPSNVKVKHMLMASGLQLPRNLLILDAKSIITSYRVADDSQAVVVYGSKMSIELAPFVPVVVCGEAWVRNKGLAFELGSREDLSEIILKALDSKMDETNQLKALKYAYHVFFQRFIEVEGLVQLSSHYPPFELPKGEQAQLLLNSAGIRSITNGIMKGNPFVLDPE